MVGTADLFEHLALQGSAGESTELGDELPHGVVVFEIAIPRHMRRQIALQPRLVIPVGTGRIARSPFFPSWIGRLDVDELLAVPESTQSQVRVEPSVRLREFFEVVRCPRK